MMRHSSAPKLGLGANLGQFTLLVLVNALVGAMIGLERSILPELAQSGFGLEAKSAVLSFIAAFGISKAATNYLAGRLSETWGRKPILVLGWILAMPVPFLLIWAQTWNWILAANVLLGVSQGLTWSTTVIMKIDLIGPERRGLAMGLNEFAGYLAVAGSALATGAIASRYGLRPAPFYLGVVYAILGTLMSVVLVRETLGHAALEAAALRKRGQASISQSEVFLRTTFKDRDLSAITQAGLVNNLNDGMAWGLFPLLYSTLGIDLARIGVLAAVYPATWGILQLWTGHLSDRLGRKWLIAGGMLIQAGGLAVFTVADQFAWFVVGGGLLGLGTAMVYPTLLAAIGDIAHPSWRASSVGVYRLWRDLGYAIGAILSGVIADRLGLRAAIGAVTLVTALSGIWVIARLRETR